MKVESMKYKIVHYSDRNSIPEDTISKMTDVVRDVYSDASAEEFKNEVEGRFTYEYTVIFDEDGDEIIALACLGKSGIDFDIWEFAWDMVREEHRGKGLGRKLNDERIMRVKEYGGKKILLVTKKMWHFERNNFHTVCVFEDGDNLMVCEL